MTLDQLRALCDAATPGPWKAHVHHSLHGAPAVDAGRGLFVCACATASDQSGVKDAAFIAAARTALPLLLAVAEAARDVVRFTAPEWRDDVDRGDADTALADALAALEAAP